MERISNIAIKAIYVSVVLLIIIFGLLYSTAPVQYDKEVENADTLFTDTQCGFID